MDQPNDIGNSAIPEPESVSSPTREWREMISAGLDAGGAFVALGQAELGLARASAVSWCLWVLVGILALAGIWATTTVALVLALSALAGSLVAGCLGTAMVNLAVAAFATVMMRRCRRDLGLPRTRRALAQLVAPSPT